MSKEKMQRMNQKKSNENPGKKSGDPKKSNKDSEKNPKDQEKKCKDREKAQQKLQKSKRAKSREKKRKMKLVVDILDIIIITLAFSFSVLLLLPGLFNTEPKIVLSGSMSPTYDAGAVVFVNKNLTSPEVGDIIAYSTGEATITHRVIGTDSTGAYITKGDANDTEDLSPVSPEQVVGTVTFWIPYLGYGISFVRSKKGIIIIATIVAAYFIFTMLIREIEK